MDDKALVEYVAKLARIALSSQEESEIAGQFHKILDYVDKLKTVDVEGVEPMRAALIERDVLREDKVVASDLARDILANAPAREGDYFKTPKIIE